MTHSQRNLDEQCSSFTITQFALGSPLQFEPGLGSQELDNLINNYVPGSAMPQQKRAQVVLEFLNSIDALSYAHPVSIRYHVPQVLTPQMMPRHSLMPSMSAPAPSPATFYDYSTVKDEALNTSKSTRSLKRSREEVAPPNASSAKRLPGFSIMTRDGTDITDLASRGPKTKEQRDHAALMRKLKACAACKKSKQRCDPSHHHLAQSTLSTPSSATPSDRSARLSCVSSTGGSRGSISPQSSLGESFTQSPTRSFVGRTVAQTGQSFPSFPTTKPAISPSDFTLPDAMLTGSDLSALPMQDFDPELFQLADMELDSWNTDFTAFPPVHINSAWNNHEDTFAPNFSDTASQPIQGIGSQEQVRSDSLPHPSQSRSAHQAGQTVRDAVYDDSLIAGFNIDQSLNLATDLDDRHPGYQSQPAAGDHTDMLKHIPLQRGLQNPTLSRDQDYILYPDSPQFELGLEPHLISRDIGNKEWLPRKFGSQASGKHQMDASLHGKDSRGPASSESKSSSSNSQVSTAQPRQLHEDVAQYQYPPSPPPSDGSEESQCTSVFERDASDTEDTAYDMQDSLSQCSIQSDYAQSRRRQVNSSRLNLVQPQSSISVSGNDDLDRYHSVVHRTPLSPGEPQDLRSVITADVNVGYQSRSDQLNKTRFSRPEEQPTGLPIPDLQNHAMNVLDDQQAQQTLINRDPHTSLVDHEHWDLLWKESELRQAGLLGMSAGGNLVSRLRPSSHDRIQVQATVDDSHIYDQVIFESRQQPSRIAISSDIPGEDETKIFSLDTLKQQRVLTILTLCSLMTISLLWAISLLSAAANYHLAIPKLSLGSEAIFSWIETGCLAGDSQNDVRSISFEHHSHRFPYQSNPGPGPVHTTISNLDFLYPGPDDVKDSESSHVFLDSRPESETLTILADNSSTTSESRPGQWIHQPSPSASALPPPPSTSLPSRLSGPDAPAFTRATTSATTKCASTWTTLLPARPTTSSSPPKEEEKHASVMTKLHSQRQSSSIRGPATRKVTMELKRTWSRRFNIGHLAMQITSLTIL